jgi:riboflavin synthase
LRLSKAKERMFTGIIEQTGVIKTLRRPGGGMRLSILASHELEGARPGDSVAVNGACLTVVELAGALFSVDVSPETVHRTTLKEAKPGDRVNLERAMRLGGRLDGHLVTGHVDGVGILSSRTPKDNAILLGFKVPPALARYMVEKGSVAVDGVSLTINSAGPEDFSVAVIPHTAALTTVSAKKPGEMCNIECDIIAKYVERFVTNTRAPSENGKGGVTMDFLARNGFL